jgi:hypothetical protein
LGGEQRHRGRVLHAVADRVGHERLEQGARDRAHLEDAEDADVALGRARQEHEHPVAAGDTEPGEHVGEPVREPHQVLERVLLHALAVGVEERELVLARGAAVPVDALVRHVELAAAEPVELGLDLLPVEAGIGLVVVLEVGGVVGFGRQDFLGHRHLPRGGRGLRSQAPETYRQTAAASTDGALARGAEPSPAAWTTVPGFCFTIGMIPNRPHADR